LRLAAPDVLEVGEEKARQETGPEQEETVRTIFRRTPVPAPCTLDSARFGMYQGRMGRLKMRTPRAKRSRKATPPARPRGLRIQLKGTRTPSELRDMLRQALERIVEHGITHMSGINLYVTPVDASGAPVTPVMNGQTVSSIVVEAPYNSAADEYGL
jgi:hypothetical protein